MTKEIPTIQPDLLSTVERPQLPALRAPDLLPAQLPASKGMSIRRLRVALAIFVVVGAAGGGFSWWQHSRSELPPGIASGNGRIEADEIDIDTKFAGRIAEILADQGDMVKAGQIVARMDTRDLAASLKKSEAQVRQAQKAIEEANANVVQQTSQMLLAQQEFDRATPRAEGRPNQASGGPASGTAPMPP